MNFSLRESMIGGGQKISIQQRRRLSLNGVSSSKDSSSDNLELFSDESDVSVKLGRLSIESAKPGMSAPDDPLSSTDGGKHDYDWLLTPPGTPLVPSSHGNEKKPTHLASRSKPLIRSISTSKALRPSASQSESTPSTRPTRSSSAARPSVSSSQYSVNSNKLNSMLNTSSASVSSYIRSSTPGRSSSITRPSTPSARPKISRSSTPSKVHPAPGTVSIEKPKPVQTSRPSTPTSRPQISANVNSTARQSTSRPSTPTRRNPAPSSSPATGSSATGGRGLTRQNLASVSRPSSPGPRVRPQPQPIVPPDFPLETPPNLRTTLPERPPSAGRSRPGAALTLKGNIDTSSSATLPRRQLSPMVARGRISESTGRAQMLANGQLGDANDSRRELSARKPVKKSTGSTGSGWTISRKSPDVAIRNMDIKSSANGFRPLAGLNRYPQSIRLINQKSHSGRSLNAATSVNGSMPISKNGLIAENGNHNWSSESGNEDRSSAKLSNVEIYESSRYDMILLKEDLKNTNWLHSIEDQADQEFIFDSGLEPLPEPFGPI